MDVTKSSTVLAPAQFIYDWHTNLAAFDRLLPPWQSIDIHNVNGSLLYYNKDGTIAVDHLTGG